MHPIPLALLFAAAVSPMSASAQSAADTADQVGKTAGNVATKPLKDANIVKTEIPPELTAIMNNPYSLAGLSTCAQYSAEIAKMTKVLGPDVDAQTPSGGDSASEMVLSQIEQTAGGLVPASGIIRKVSGAEAQEKKAKAAVYAGSLRRAYLKGTARAKGCKI